MSLLSEWNERKKVSPHRPGRPRTWRLVFVFLLVLVAFWVLGRVG